MINVFHAVDRRSVNLRLVCAVGLLLSHMAESHGEELVKHDSVGVKLPLSANSAKEFLKKLIINGENQNPSRAFAFQTPKVTVHAYLFDPYSGVKRIHLVVITETSGRCLLKTFKTIEDVTTDDLTVELRNGILTVLLSSEKNSILTDDLRLDD